MDLINNLLRVGGGGGGVFEMISIHNQLVCLPQRDQ